MTDKTKPIGRKEVEALTYELHTYPDFRLSYDESKSLLAIATHFFKTHNDDGTLKEVVEDENIDDPEPFI